MSFWTIVTAVELVWIIALSGWIILERRSPVATLAWIFALALLPALGVIIYYLLGPRRLSRKKTRRARSQRLIQNSIRQLDGSRSERNVAQLAKLGIASGESPPDSASNVSLYLEGDDCYDAIANAIESATHHVHLLYYIMEPDAVGTRFLDLLVKKAKAGVEVRLLLDAIGSARAGNRFVKPLIEAGGEVDWFNRVRLWSARGQLGNFRNHRKIVVCDGRIGFTGGMNVCNSHSAKASGGTSGGADATLPWRDTHMSFEGPAVRALQAVFLEDWHYAKGELVEGTNYFPDAVGATETLIQTIASGPDRMVPAIHQMFFAAITGARERVWITTPYFVPDEAIFNALTTTALRRVDVRLLVPKNGDSRLVDYAARSYFPELLRAGVQIFEYVPRVLHAKTMVVDSDVAIVGTANMDNRSFRLNFEVISVVYDAGVTQAMSDVFEKDLLDATAVRPLQLSREPITQRFGESVARLLSPLL